MEMTGPSAAILAIAMLAAFALLGGAWALYRRTGERKRPVLMAVMALVLVGNVMIWTLPV